MARLLGIGSTGPDVVDFQSLLNVFPSDYDPLDVDGIFGPLTRERTQEFQSDSSLVPDGVAGQQTWDQLFSQAIRTGDLTPLNRWQIAETARAEASAGGVFAKLSIEYDYDADLPLRWGYQKLLKYFRTSAPQPGQLNQSVFNEDSIMYLTTPGELAPCPHWCGIFALWAIKTAGMIVGNWVVSKGISVVSGFSQIKAGDVDKGDVGYVHKPFMHHFIIDNVFVQGGVRKVNTIEGNSSPSSNFSFKTRDVSSISAFYSIFH